MECSPPCAGRLEISSPRAQRGKWPITACNDAAAHAARFDGSVHSCRANRMVTSWDRPLVVDHECGRDQSGFQNDCVSLVGVREFQLRSTDVLMLKNGAGNLVRMDRGSSERLHTTVKVVAPVEQPLSSFSCERPGRNRPASHAGMAGFPPAGGPNRISTDVDQTEISSNSGSNGIPPDGGPKRTGNSTERRTKTSALPPRRWSKRNLAQEEKSTGSRIHLLPRRRFLTGSLRQVQGGRRRLSAVREAHWPAAYSMLVVSDAQHRTKSLVTQSSVRPTVEVRWHFCAGSANQFHESVRLARQEITSSSPSDCEVSNGRIIDSERVRLQSLVEASNSSGCSSVTVSIVGSSHAKPK